jgi:hypothetical protein
MLALYGAVTVSLAALFGQPTISTPSGAAVVIALLAGGLLLVSPSPTPLSPWRAVVVVVIVIGAVVAITAQQPFHDRPPGEAAWELGSSNFLLFALALRGRLLLAWIGELAMITAVGVWSVVVTGSPLYGVSFTYGQPVSLIAGTVFAIALHRTARRIIEFRIAEQQRATAEARDAETSGSQDAELHLVRTLAEPTLRSIGALQAPERAGVRTLEAALRDLIRGRTLAVEPLVSVLRSARERGIDIIVLDDLGESRLPEGELSRALEWCARLIADCPASSITIRIAPSDEIIHADAIVTVSIDGEPARTLTLNDAVSG